MLLVPRTCVRQFDTKDDRAAEPTPLNDTQALMAYVLLGDPGLGKSEAFRQEADAVGGHRISAGDFLALDHPELKDSALPVFIDGLDETRAGINTVCLDDFWYADRPSPPGDGLWLVPRQCWATAPA
jgi:hypothetical protein